MTSKGYSDIDNAFESLLQSYAEPVADNGFSAATLDQIKARTLLRKRVLIGATLVGGGIAASQTPSLWITLESVTIPEGHPLILTALGLLGFVAWAALDREWNDAV